MYNRHSRSIHEIKLRNIKIKHYRLIPIKVTVLFVSVKSSELCFFSFCFVVLTLKNKLCHLSVDSAIVFYINTIIYSLKISFKPEFLSSAEHTC